MGTDLGLMVGKEGDGGSQFRERGLEILNVVMSLDS
jgi:hypothetical protein